ncbi:Cell division protein FtsN [Buchnera aphidicola (Protaphis terricola)]
MYKNQNQISSMSFKRKKKIKFSKFNLFSILMIVIISLFFFNLFFKKTKKINKICIQSQKNSELLPDIPKEKWKYIKKLKNL